MMNPFLNRLSNPNEERLIERFVNLLMTSGNKSKSRAILYKVLLTLPVSVTNAVENVKPILEVRKVRVGGKTYEVPALLKAQRQETMAIRWIVQSAIKERKRHNTIARCILTEIVNASQKKGQARKKRDDLHRKAEDNRAFLHYRWW
jgi:small subunit ribosomal protein S7